MKRTETIRKSLEPTSGRTALRRAALFTAGALAMLAGAALGQTLEETLPQKNLAFPQVATGPTLETVICLTNRGDTAYRGVLRFWKGSNQDWNPVVNGGRISGSALDITVGTGETRIFRITGDSLLEAGAAVIVAEDLSLDNFIEGSLTYTFEGQDYDSVGITPAFGLYRSVIPFEDFASVGLALANANPHRAADVTLRLIDELGGERESALRVLPGRSHEARFLSEIFATEVGTGKVEIESTAPILGTAVTLTRGEISALPMLPSPYAYTVSFRSLGRTDEAEAVLWAEGVFAKGYLRFLRLDGRVNTNPVTYLLSGTLENGVLRLFLVGAGSDVGGREMINTLKIGGFTFNGHSYTGAYTRVYPWLSFPFTQVLGTYELTRQD